MAKAEVNKSELIREAFRSGLSTAREVIDYVKETHGAEVTVALVNNVKATLKKKAAAAKRAKASLSAASTPKAKPGPKPKGAREAIPAYAPQAKAMSHALTVGDVVEVRALLNRLGGAGVKQLIDALA